MKQLYRFLAIGAAVAGTADAATLVWSANLVRNGFDSANGTDLAPGSLLRAGYFDLTDAQIIANSTTPAGYAFLLQHFTEFAVSHIGEGVNGTAGHFSDTDNNLTATATTLAGQQIYIWAVASSNNTSDSTKIASATQHGIFYLPLTSDADWRFPLDPLTGSTQIALRDLTDFNNSTALVPEARVLAGSFGPGTSETSGKPNFTLQVVPEPSTAIAALIGGSALLLRRRRQN
jgi:hypothetical protein